jgi:hypothetical protein
LVEKGHELRRSTGSISAAGWREARRVAPTLLKLLHMPPQLSALAARILPCSAPNARHASSTDVASIISAASGIAQPAHPANPANPAHPAHPKSTHQRPLPRHATNHSTPCASSIPFCASRFPWTCATAQHPQSLSSRNRSPGQLTTEGQNLKSPASCSGLLKVVHGIRSCH